MYICTHPTSLFLPPSLPFSHPHAPRYYISMDSDGCTELCGGKELGDKCLQKLVSCMEFVFRENVVISLVASVNQCLQEYR